MSHKKCLILKRKNCIVMNHSSNYRQIEKRGKVALMFGGNFLCLAATTSPERSLPKLDGTLKIKARVST